MSNELLYIGGTAIGISFLFALFTFLKSKGFNVLSIFSSATNGIKEIEEVTEAISEFSTGKIKKALDFSATMEKISLDGINYAQQRYVSSQIDDPDGTKRKDTALEYIYANLKNAGITIDDNVQTIAKGIVESSVFSNKTISELNDKINKFIDEKVKPLMVDKENLQKQIDTLNQENATLKTNNEELQQKITTVQNTIVPIE